MLIPLILIGAVLYHALFEAKSQYAVLYVPMMAPYAAFGLKKFGEIKLFSRLRKKMDGEKMK
jgi:hypothetical protein